MERENLNKLGENLVYIERSNKTNPKDEMSF